MTNAAPIRHIRENVLGMRQNTFAALAGTSQATVSRWESGELEPSRDQLKLIRQAAIDQGIEWDDSWFFEVPWVPA